MKEFAAETSPVREFGEATTQHIPAVRDLISRNLAANLGENASEVGFLSWLPPEEYLADVIEKSFIPISTEGENVLGFIITLNKELAEANPLFQEMLAAIDNINFDGKPISEYKYLIFAQSCIDEPYRLSSVAGRLYKKAIDKAKELGIEIVIGQVVSSNNKSMSVHGGVADQAGSYKSKTSGLEWNVFVRDLRK